ncbi:muscarinic acetylcholine receptor M1-like [Corythoichthys intestinalis]|uniref:muscarinic acetylcholine receptor M1-like n=1 Tax=Corythoichthys intestinalis TaxID=161448 RepID=UPI0025A4CC67|nr:muscarinic acetylcholine receptor M1-like [Corythoichthys intestinalis]XP_057682176.1 muscarinic acetylcholine receptor M1-like [Corythoichthys intestinalis]XP_057682177.1 muscarinic acetylcholine receptor M1-like [Corythoichthys intestinalis]
MEETSRSDPAFITTTFDGSYQEVAILSGSVGHWSTQQFNGSHIIWHGGNATESPGNGTLMQGDATFDPLGGHTIWQVIVIVFLTGSLSLVTVVGNILVLVSFKINKALKTVNNYYLLSLAFADLTIGTLSMNLYTTYIIMSQWALGPVICDLWLAIDYVASNASVMNLLVISFDRYFSVTRPLTYRAKRTTKRAMTMICLAWSTSFILWAPAILFWQYIVGERTVPDNECFIQFLSEPIITFCTAIAAFYLPVTVMTTLFWKIYQETEKRAKDIQGLKGSGAGNSQSQNHRSGDSVNKSQKEKSETSTQQMNDGNDEQNQLPSENDKDNSSLPRGMKSRGKFISCFSSHLCSGFKKSNATAAAKRCGDSLNNNDASEEEEEVNDADQTRLSTDEKKTKRPKENNSELNNSQPGDPSPENTSLKEGATVKKFAAKAKTEVNKRKNEKKANDKKAAKTLSAILLAFITTWLPYNIMVLVNTFCEDCIPGTLWALGYWLCYVNSTINPMCYALCNKTFRNTFKSILMCQWNQNKSKPQFNKRNPAACRK